MKTITLELPDDLHERLKELAAEINATVEDTIVAILCQYLFTLANPPAERSSPEEQQKMYNELTKGQQKAYNTLNKYHNSRGGNTKA